MELKEVVRTINTWENKILFRINYYKNDSINEVSGILDNGTPVFLKFNDPNVDPIRSDDIPDVIPCNDDFLNNKY